jgi:outer membrane protein TolC
MARKRRIWGWWLGLALLAGPALPVSAQLGPPVANVQVPSLSLEQAVALALQNNADLAVIRKQHGVAAAGIVIADTYPFNPVYQNYLYNTNGPASAGITNRFSTLQTIRLDLELRGQGKIRRSAAQATLSRTQWDIANQELLVAVRTLRAFATLIYRRDKLELLEEAVHIQEEVLQRVQRLVERGQLRPVELQTAKADLVEARAAVGPARALQVLSWNDLRRALGLEGALPELRGGLDTTCAEAAIPELCQFARQHRPDLRALQMVVVETSERVRLEIANRYGNPSLGPAYDYNETRVNFIGAWFLYALPVLNTRRGDILQRQAERERALADVRRLEIQVGQDVQAARDRLSEAHKWVRYFADESIPTLQTMVETLEKLFEQGEIDPLRPLDARRRLLRARDSYLDALWELSQARADLAAALGDFTVVMCPTAPATAPMPRPVLLTPIGISQ